MKNYVLIICALISFDLVAQPCTKKVERKKIVQDGFYKLRDYLMQIRTDEIWILNPEKLMEVVTIHPDGKVTTGDAGGKFAGSEDGLEDILGTSIATFSAFNGCLRRMKAQYAVVS